jgi:predicted phosphodiesterase
MRLAALADTHGNLVALEAALADLEALGGADRIWVLGDLANYGPRPAECIQRLQGLPNVEIISGNGDRYLATGERSTVRLPVDEKRWATLADELMTREASFVWTLRQLEYKHFEFLASLRGELELHVPGYGWVIGYHGTPGDDESLIPPDMPADEALDFFMDREGRMGLGAHTHRPMDRDLGPWRLVNVGSVGLSLGTRRAEYALITFEGGTAHVDLRQVPYDVDAHIADMHARGCPFAAEVGTVLTEDREEMMPWNHRGQEGR